MTTSLHRRDWLKQAALAVAAFGMSKDIFANNIPPNLVGSSADIIKLSSNENPHGPSPAARKAMIEAVLKSNRYPWEMTTQLREKIGAAFSLTKEHITIGAGSSELLGVVSTLAMMKKGFAVAPDPTFRLWIPAAKAIGLDVKLVPLNAEKIIDLKALKAAMNEHTKMVYICNPNNPTGTILPAAALEAFIKEVAPTCIILLDEAYTEFCEEPSMAKWVNDYPNLIVAKTFSKIYGLAGARIGYAIAHPETIKAINALQPWANAGAGTAALAGALASFNDQQFIEYCKTENTKARQILYDALQKNNISYIPSHTSFVYFNAASYKGDIRSALQSKNIVGARTFEEGTTWYRLSIGTVEEMKKVAQALSA